MAQNFILPGLRDNSQGDVGRSTFYNNDSHLNKSEDMQTRRINGQKSNSLSVQNNEYQGAYT